jgi:hypothetical protein
MPDLEHDLPRLLADLADRAPHDPDLAAAVRRRARAHRRRWVGLAAAAALVVAAGSGALWQQHRDGEQVATVVSDPCRDASTPRELPPWATAGFTDPRPVATYATSVTGDLVAITFGPLTSPPEPGRNNKVLWVSQVAVAGRLQLHATLEGTDVTADVVVPNGFGPSTVDLPRPGCWRVEVTWDGGRDQIWLPYAASGTSEPAAASPDSAASAGSATG